MRALGETELVVELGSKTFSLRWALSLAYDTRPPSGRERLDSALKAGLRVQF